MLNHGFKAVQIGTSAWTAEALKNTMPASVFSRSTECHNQDKVSMGTIAARDAIRVLELTEQVAAATLLAANQGVWLRARQADARPLPPALARCTRLLARTSPGHRRPRPGRRTAPVPATYRRATLEAACVAPGCSRRHGNPRAVLRRRQHERGLARALRQVPGSRPLRLARRSATTTGMLESGYAWPVIDLQLRYVRGATFGQR
jgi:hypothetical protein